MAKQIAASGRYGDSEILHVNPLEVKFLEGIAGTLPRNPDTGAKEAFFFLPLLAPFLGKIAAGIGLKAGLGALVAKGAMAGGAAIGDALLTKKLAGGGGQGEAQAPLSGGQSRATYDHTIPIVEQRVVTGPGGLPKLERVVTGYYTLDPSGKPVNITKTEEQQQAFNNGGKVRDCYAGGGRVRGPGGGIADMVPATVNGRRPVRLSDGEFVVPADVVSHLGDGSTDAGAAKLQQMIAAVRAMKTGRPAQPPPMGGEQ
jgi:hypothetical protein